MERFLFDGPERAALTLVLAHGAGAPMDATFMNRMAAGIGAAGIRVARFEFPYMNARRETGRRGPPDRPSVLRESWFEAIRSLSENGAGSLVIGGKSMGGRIASMVADEAGVGGLVCLGYPFHPPGQPSKLRVAHLEELRTPTLIVQGTRDALGGREEIGTYALSKAIRVSFLEDGDHSFKPRAASGRTEAQNLAEATTLAVEFLRGTLAG